MVIIIIPAALLLQRARRARVTGDDRSRRQRLDYQPAAKPVWVPVPVPLSGRTRTEQPVPPAPAVEEDTGEDILENCRNLADCLLALTGKYSLDSFTIATSDGLVFASSGGETAQVDAARFSRDNAGKDLSGVVLFALNHKGSALTGIIRSPAAISPETRKRIERDTKVILNKWI